MTFLLLFLCKQKVRLGQNKQLQSKKQQNGISKELSHTKLRWST